MHAFRSGLGARVGSGLVDIGLAHAWAALALTGIALALGAGCGGGDAIPLDKLGAELGASYCVREANCAGGPPPSVCEASTSFGNNQIIQSLIDAINRGTVLYDGARARECVDALARSCIEFLGSPPACDEAFRGTVAANGACRIGAECVSGSCEGACDDACCVGACGAGAAKVVVGGDCSAGATCVNGAFCSNGKCAPQLELGAACIAGDACRSPGHCEFVSGAAGTCVGPPAEGASCSNVSGCLSMQDYCNPVTLVCTRRKAVGAACNEASDECQQAAFCRNGVCWLAPTLGQPCDTSCFGNLVCSQGTCVPGPSPTNPCG